MNAVGYQLIPVNINQIDALVSEAVNQVAFLPIRGEDETPFLLTMQAEFAGDPDYQIFAIQQRELPPAGFIVLLPSRGPEYRAIGPMYIQVAERGKGLGRLQVEYLIAWARAQQINYLYTQTWGSNRASRRIFESLGFIQMRIKPNTRVNGDSSITYALEINP